MEKDYKVVLTGIKQVELQEDCVPELSDDQFLVKSEVSQISIGTELTCLECNVEAGSKWLEEDIKYPMRSGYSTVGKIVAAGKNVPADYVGKRVMIAKPHGKYHVMDAPRTDLYFFLPDCVMSEDAVFSTLGQVAMASIRIAKIRPGETCVVYGAGLVGQLAARLAKVAGASTVIVTDVSDLRLDKVPKEPCFVTVNSKKENVKEKVKALTNGRGADVVFETTSVPQLIQEEMECLVQAGMGRLIITSSPKGKSLVDFDYCSRAGITIIGAMNHSVHTEVETFSDRWTRQNDSIYFVELLEKKLIDLDGMITHEFNYKDAVSAYEMLMADRTQALAVHFIWED